MRSPQLCPGDNKFGDLEVNSSDNLMQQEKTFDINTKVAPSLLNFDGLDGGLKTRKHFQTDKSANNSLHLNSSINTILEAGQDWQHQKKGASLDHSDDGQVCMTEEEMVATAQEVFQMIA